MGINILRDAFFGGSIGGYDGSTRNWAGWFMDFWQMVKPRCSGVLWCEVLSCILLLESEVRHLLNKGLHHLCMCLCGVLVQLMIPFTLPSSSLRSTQRRAYLFLTPWSYSMETPYTQTYTQSRRTPTSTCPRIAAIRGTAPPPSHKVRDLDSGEFAPETATTTEEHRS